MIFIIMYVFIKLVSYVLWSVALVLLIQQNTVEGTLALLSAYMYWKEISTQIEYP